MALILNIDTATSYAGVCLSEDGHVLVQEESYEQKNHGAFIQPAIEKIMQATGLSLQRVDAVAVSNGPGSYTGLRVGLSTAKGICYALKKPLLLLSTLEIMAIGMKDDGNHEQGTLFCPMIDARRMEVFTAVYTDTLQTVLAPCAMILDENSFSTLLETNRIVFAGSGQEKLKQVLHHPNAVFSGHQHHAANMAGLAYALLMENKFADLAYSAPFYLKEFYNYRSNY